jgi:hypothetical protein
MEKTYLVYDEYNGASYSGVSYDEAVVKAKRLMEKRKTETVTIYKAAAMIKAPVPEYEVITLT